MAKIESTSLFPILPSATRSLTGLARLAAEAEHVADGHQIEFRTLEVRSILNKAVSRRLPSLAYSINPYRGCEFACRYCYARYTHEFLAPKTAFPAAASIAPDTLDLRSPEAFERLIFLKQNAAWLLEQELRKIDPAQEIALGTATDPYQPIERRARITRSLLEVFARRAGYRLSLVTKSRLIARDIDLLKRIAERNTLVLHLTITTPDAALARLLEPRAPRPDLRFETVRRLRAAGLTAGILCSPLLPGITDTEAALDRMAALAAQADASFLDAQPLFLKPCSRSTYMAFIHDHFPDRESDTHSRFAHDDFAAPAYRHRLTALVAKVRARYGLHERSTGALFTRHAGTVRKPATSVIPPLQNELFA